MTLTEIANKHGTDKGTTVAEKHNHTSIYENYFEDIRFKSLKILEIGIMDPSFPGASLKTWYEYFPNSKIYGIDIKDAKRFDNDRITTSITDQGDLSSLSKFIKIHGGDFDIIIDDGSHFSSHIFLSLSFLFSYLNPKGIYCIEDLHASQALEAKTNLESKQVPINSKLIQTLDLYEKVCVLVKK